MNLFFQDPMYERQVLGLLGGTSYGLGDLGECVATARRIQDGDAESWHREWRATADRIYSIGEDCASKGRRVSAREAYLRATAYYRTAYLFLFGAPVDPRLVDAFDRESEAFRKAAALFDPPLEPVEIPYEATTLPGYFCRAEATEQPRPTVVCTNGYDATVHLMYNQAAAAVRRGYHCLLFDGPGQGRALIKQNLPMRPDWEKVVTPVVDYALSRPEVDPKRLALMGWSFGGYLAPRAASYEHRLAACIADPGQWDLLEAMKGMLTFLPEKTRQKLPDVTAEELRPFEEALKASFALRWSVVQRAFWVHGITSVQEYLQLASQYSLARCAKNIRSPTLVAWAENDPIAHLAERLYDALSCPKQFVRFTAAEGAGDHCESLARSLFHQRAFDWLDGVLK